MRRLILTALLISAALTPAGAFAIPDGGIELVSRPTGFGPLPFDGASYAYLGPHSISADGCKIVFRSNNDVLSDQDDDAGDDIFRVDRCAPGQPVVLVSATATGVPGDGESLNPTISADGNRVAFTTRARNLLPAGTTTRSSTVVKDIPSGDVLLAARGDGANGAAAESSEGIISADGGAVAFQARGFVDGINADGTATDDVYVRFLSGHQTVMASAKMGASGGADYGFDVSSDGSRVVFLSRTSFVPGDVDAAYDAYLADVSPNGTVGRQLVAGTQEPDAVALSDNGSTVGLADDRVWISACPSSPCGAPVQVDGAPAGTGARIYGLAFPRAADAPKHLLWTTDRALLPLDTNTDYDMYVATLGTTPALSLPFGHIAHGARAGDVTDDLSVAIAESWSLDLPGTNGAETQVFVRAGGQTTLLSQPAGVPPRRSETGDTQLDQHALSENGRFVAMNSQSGALGAPLLSEDARYAHEIVVREVAGGVTTMASVAADGSPGNESSTDASIDASGSRVAFASLATNLVPGVPGGSWKVYVRDLATGATQLVDRKADGSPVGGGSDTPDLSRDGTKVGLLSRSPDLPGYDGSAHVYLADLATGTITLVDRTPADVAADASASELTLDADGSRVAFVSRATNLGTTDPGAKVFVKDLGTGEVTYVSVPESAAAQQNAGSVSIDGAGTHVSWSEEAAGFGYGSDGYRHIFVRDVAAGSTTLASVGGADGPGEQEYTGELDGSGSRLVFVRSGPGYRPQAYLRDLDAGVTEALLPDRSHGAFGVSISPDGICAGLNSNSPDVVDHNPSPDFNQVYLRAIGGSCAPRPDASQPGGGTGGAGADTTPPVIAGLRMTRTRFPVRRRASAFLFTLSEDSRASVAIARCVKLRKRACRRYRVVATLTRAHAKHGPNRIAFSGKIGRRKLKLGRYRATVGAVDAAGNSAVPRRVRFTIVRR